MQIKPSISHDYNITIDQFVEIAQEERDKWLEKGKELRFDINDKVEEDVFILKVKSEDEVWDIAGPGAIGVIAGPPKSRKTAIISAIEASGLSGRDVLGFSLDINKGRILSIDTEQRKGSFAKVKRNVYDWAGIKGGYNPPNYDTFWLRNLYPDERLKFTIAHAMSDPKPKLLIIDIITDLMYDFNDHIKAQKLVEDVMKMAGKETLTLVTIHLGKGGLVLGHIGSALARKVDFLIEVTLDEDRYNSIISNKLSRDVPLFPDFKIRQERHPNRIYRPDLEIGGWKSSFVETQEAEDDFVPF